MRKRNSYAPLLPFRRHESFPVPRPPKEVIAKSHTATPLLGACMAHEKAGRTATFDENLATRGSVIDLFA
ncbi:MAG: hypothetical protein AAB727_02720 [Patescibacteria group bacterium]